MTDPKDKEKMVLSHEPVPGYRAAFYVVITVASLYLAYIFAVS